MRVPTALLVALAFRSLSLLLPHTFFQPDEFYQAFEPAYARVFGTGYLTWEWRDLPPPLHGGSTSWWDTAVAGGRLRGWIWPGVFVLVYEAVRRLGLEDTPFITLAPRLVGVVVAALTDYYTFLLAGRVLGRRSAPTALFLSLTSLFNAHLLPRALSTSPETLLTVAAVYYYPLPAQEPQEPRASLQPGHGKRDEAPNGSGTYTSSRTGTGTSTGSDLDCYNYSGMDRIDDPSQQRRSAASANGNVLLAAALAALSICIRPTMLVFWGYMHLERSAAAWCTRGIAGVADLTFKTLLGGLAVAAASTALDYHMVGRLTLPVLSFVHVNVVQNIAAFYGATGLLYHVVQSLPLLLFPLWYWWTQGYAAALLPTRWLPATLARLDRPAPLRTLARVVLFTLAVLSLSPHSEWRFVHPLLPLLLLFAIPALQRTNVPTMMGADSPGMAFRQYFRLSRRAFALILLAPMLPFVYLNVWHGAAQVSVANALREGRFGEVSKLTVLMPCHSTPWASHLGTVASAGDSWFTTCEPPLHDQTREKHRTEQELLYAHHVSYVQRIFPRPPAHLEDLSESEATAELPSHVLLFGCLLDEVEPLGAGGAPVSVRDALGARGYVEAASLWNGFDFAQDEEKRRGGVRVWVRSDVPVSLSS